MTYVNHLITNYINYKGAVIACIVNVDESKREKALDLIANKILHTCLIGSIAPPAKIRMIKLLIEIYGDAMVRDHIIQTLAIMKIKDGK